MSSRPAPAFVLASLLALAASGCGTQTDPGPPLTPDMQALQRHLDVHPWIGTRVKPVLLRPRVQSPGEPVPIPGGLDVGLHVWLPGPEELGFQGTDVEPNVITNFQGFAAIAFLAGEALGSDGQTYDM